MSDPEFLNAPGEGVWATDATDRVVFVHGGSPPLDGEVRDVRVGMHALDSGSASLVALKPWYRRARGTLMPLRYKRVTVRTSQGPRHITGSLTPLLDGGRFAGMLCTASSMPAPARPSAGAAVAGGEHHPSAHDDRFTFWDVHTTNRRLMLDGLVAQRFGYAAAEVGPRAMDHLRIVHPDDRRTVARAFGALRRQPTGRLELRCRIVGKDGSLHWVLMAGMPRQDTATGATAVCGFIFDMTAARDAERALLDSEAHYRSIVELQTEAISRFLPDGTMVFVNASYCRVFGRQAADLVGQRWHPVAHPDDVPMIEDCLRSMSAADPVVVIENRVSVADGSWRWMQFVNRGIYDSDGVLTQVLSVGRDLTRLKRIEAELRDSEERLQMALAGAAQVSWDWNLAARSLHAAAVWTELLGHPPAAAPHDEDAWWRLIHPADLADFRRRLAAHLSGESAIFESEYRMRHKAGHWLWVESRGKVTLRTEAGQPLRMVGTLRDISQRRRLHDEGVDVVKRIETLIRHATQPALPEVSVKESLQGLTPREREILVLVAKGLSSAQIGQHLHLSTNTIGSHRRNLMAKLDLHRSVEIARFAHAHGLLSGD